MYYGTDYYPEHWPRERWELDARLMREAGINLVRLAEFAWAQLEPAEDAYEFGWLDEAIALLSRHGIATVLGTPTATPPAWLCQRYPEVMRWDRDGRRVTFGMRRQYCPTSPTYREHTRRIVAAMAERYRGNTNVIAWQLDNEFGCHDSTRCYCPACQAAFQAWARERYGSLEALNDAWGAAFWSHVYTSWRQIPLPWSTAGVSNPCLELDFWRFASQQTVDYAQIQVDVLRSLCPNQMITTNLMGLGFRDIDYYDLTQPLDLVSWDNYPIYQGEREPAAAALSHALMRGYKQRPFWVMEQQAGPSGWQTMSRAPKPGQLRLWAYQGIAHGADAIVYFRWRTCPFNTEEYWHGILDHDGRPRRRYEEIRQMGQEIARFGERLVGTSSPKRVAILFSYNDSFAFRLQPNVAGFDYGRLLSDYYRALHDLNVPVDIVSPDAELGGYALVVAPTLHVLHADWADKLKDYVAGGGYLAVGARSGVKDLSNRVVQMPLPGLLAELCGIEVWEYDPLGREGTGGIRFEPRIAPIGGAECLVSMWCDILKPTSAEVVARYTSDYYAGEPAITQNAWGKGRAVYVGVIGDGALYEALARWWLNETGVQPLLSAPPQVEAVLRQGQDASYLFVLNHGAEHETVRLPYRGEDLVTQRLYEGEITLAPRQVLVLAVQGAQD
ncbi:MAG: beta-galactosidase [Chloroflexi bacterium]|nr:beta-galactosidase [Chloroflexota bacterium]